MRVSGDEGIVLSPLKGVPQVKKQGESLDLIRTLLSCAPPEETWNMIIRAL